MGKMQDTLSVVQEKCLLKIGPLIIFSDMLDECHTLCQSLLMSLLCEDVLCSIKHERIHSGEKP